MTIETLDSTSATSFASHSPATGVEYARYSIAGPAEVATAVAAARSAALWWSARTPRQRTATLLAWNRLIVSRIDEAAALIVAEGGKPESDARLEITLAVDHLAWAAKNAGRYLAPSRRSPGLLMINMSATVEHAPLGVVGVIGPWNYPIFTPMGSIAYALAAGNAVVFKPSQYTPGVGVWLASTLREIVPEHALLQTITGEAMTGEELCKSTVDKIAFTGSTRTAKKVAATCAESLKPLIAECGGKDAVIIAADANVKDAAENTLWAAMSNAGQTCIAAERVYVHEKVADEFIRLITAQAKSVKAGTSYGAATMPSQIGIIASHIDDALNKGGVALVGGRESVQAPFVSPVILSEVPEDSTAVTEETFGPTLVINKVKSMEEAIAKSNALRYGLGASVWSKRHGSEIASQLHAGMVSVNSVLAFAAVPSVPFGGVGDSGYGRIHGPEGLREFTYARSVIKPRFKSPIQFTTFRRTKKTDNIIAGLIKILFGR